jgi:hypothetical protein
MIKKRHSPFRLMTRIVPFLLFTYLFMWNIPAWPQEKSSPPDSTQSQGAQPDQSPTTKNGQKKPDESSPAQGSTPPASPAQPPVTTTPEGTPAQTPAPQAGPEQPPGTPATEGAPQAKPQEKVEKALQATEEEKEKTVTKQVEQSVLTSAIRGRLELELNETYAHLSSNQLFIEGFGILPILIVGPTSVERVRRDSFITTFVTRYQITPGLQAELRIPYNITYIRVSTATGIIGKSVVTTNAEQTSGGRGLGDVSGSFSYHLTNESLNLPSLYVALGFKGRTGRDVFETTDAIKDPPTGSGFNAVSLTLNAIKTADPAVVYGTLSYSYAISRQNVVLNRPNNQPPILVDFYPGDNIGYGFGIAYALNYKITMSVGYQQSINLPTRMTNLGLPHNELPNSVTDAASLRFGVVWRVNDRTSIDLSVSPGLTLDAPDLQVALRIPYRF